MLRIPLARKNLYQLARVGYNVIAFSRLMSSTWKRIYNLDNINRKIMHLSLNGIFRRAINREVSLPPCFSICHLLITGEHHALIKHWTGLITWDAYMCTSNNPLSKLIMSYFTGVYVSNSAWMNWCGVMKNHNFLNKNNLDNKHQCHWPNSWILGISKDGW